MTVAGTKQPGASFHVRDRTIEDETNPFRVRLRRVSLLVLSCVVVACGGSPLESIGFRSSDWINEPTVPTTLAVVTTSPTVVPVERLSWANDEIQTENLGDRAALVEEVFSRREGDRFVQASRFEISVALPNIAFPAEVPSGAEWVSSQLVFDNDGTIANDTSAAFGIWSAEPYSRSRTVAQMIVIRVAIAPEAAAAVESGDEEASCARFSDRTTEECEIIRVGERPTWLLKGSTGSTLIWFDEPYRYELYGRSFVPIGVLESMTAGMLPLASIAEPAS